MRGGVASALLVLAAFGCEASTSGADHEASLAGGTSSGGASSAGEMPTGGTQSTMMPEPDPAKLLAEAVVATAAADCEKFNSCAPSLLQLLYGSVEACLNRAVLWYGWQALLPGTGATPGAMRACREAFSSATCDDFFTKVSPACVLKGSLSDGASCVGSAQCVSGFCPADHSCAACAPVPRTGSSCVADSECAFGEGCRSGVCVVLGDVGQTCSATQPCNGWSICDGVCKVLPGKLGQACGSALKAPGCDSRQGLICTSVTSGTCVSYKLASTGQACGQTDAGVVRCRAGGRCVNGTCEAAAALGEACSPAGAACTWPDACVSGRCVGLSDPESCP